MTTTNTQSGQCTSEVLVPNINNEANIDQLLSNAIVVTNQSSSIQFNPTKMVTNIRKNSDLFRRYQQQQQQRHQQRQNRLQQQEAQRRLREEQQQRREQRTRRQERKRRRYEQWLQRLNDRSLQSRNDYWSDRTRRKQEELEHDQYLRSRSPGFDELMDEILEERQLEQYYLERMTPKEQQEVWEQEHLKELQENPVQWPHGILLDNLEQYAIFLEEQLQQDECEQKYQIDDMLYWDGIKP